MTTNIDAGLGEAMAEAGRLEHKRRAKPHLTSNEVRTYYEIFTELCQTVMPLAQHDFKRHANSAIAWTYAQAGTTLHQQYDNKLLLEAVRVQCGYIMANITTWRGVEAARLKADFAAFVRLLVDVGHLEVKG